MSEQIEPVRVGVIGCGAISAAYLGMAKQFPQVRIEAVADLNMEAARRAAEQFGVPRVLTVEQLLEDPAIELVLNLTIPKAHVPIALAAIAAGKHTYCEKPLGIDREQGRRVMTAAAEKKVRVGCAPDTVLGAGMQTARKLIDDGAIGRPLTFTAFMQGRGHENWHASPEFYYEVGGGPMFDMGPYYLTALLNLLGPVKRISGMAGIQIPKRTITSQPKAGKIIDVETPDHITGLLEFENGVLGTMVQSFAVLDSGHDGKHPILINGTNGAIHVPDPNEFDGTVLLHRLGEPAAVEMPLTFPVGYGRSIGLADMAAALRTGRPHRCAGEQAFYVLDLMQGFLDSSASGCVHRPESAYSRPAAMPSGPFGVL